MIAIRVVSRAGRAPSTPLAARFDEAGGDIGRSAECTLALPDAARRISRRQAVVSWRAGRYFIRRVGANLDMDLDAQPLDADLDYPLPVGCEIRIGEYLLRVDADAAEDGAEPVAPPVARAQPPRGTIDQWPDEPPPAAPSVDQIDLVVGEPTGARADRPADPLAALWAGLGAAPGAASARQLHELGALLREMVAGTIGLLAARALAKRELGAARTQLRPRENNLFKFAPDADAALALLLGPAPAGFLPPATAARAAFADLRAHQLAVLAGMRATLDAVLARFDPAALEARLTDDARLWEALLPSVRKAKLWEQYAERYAEILREVEGDFDTLFGRAFVQAYEAQLAALAPGARDADEAD